MRHNCGRVEDITKTQMSSCESYTWPAAENNKVDEGPITICARGHVCATRICARVSVLKWSTIEW